MAKDCHDGCHNCKQALTTEWLALVVSSQAGIIKYAIIGAMSFVGRDTVTMRGGIKRVEPV